MTPAGARSARLAGLALRDWQIEAFAAWAAAGCRGVVEAVTGSGKTRLALAAVHACLAQGGTALVLVPTLDLLAQWVREVRAHVPGVRVGRLGGGHDDDLHERHVVVATPHSASRLPLDPPRGGPGLLVADEAHRYGAPTWAGALQPTFAMRLALTATYERSDDGLVDVLGPYFGGVVWQYGYAQAAADGVIAPFRVGFARTTLTARERAVYDAHDRRAREHRRALVDAGLPRAPLDLVAAAAALVAEADRAATRPDGSPRPLRDGPPRVADARAYLAALRGRRDVAAQATGKLAWLEALGPALRGRRALVYADTVEQAEDAARRLVRGGVRAEPVHGGLDRDRRRIRLAQFRRGRLDAVVAPRVLDEGVDIPDADVAVVLATFQSRRQMVQRLGRVVRPKGDGRAAHLLVAFAADTREDPSSGAHAEFLGEVLPVAQDVTALASPDDAGRWLRGD